MEYQSAKILEVLWSDIYIFPFLKLCKTCINISTSRSIKCKKVNELFWDITLNHDLVIERLCCILIGFQRFIVIYGLYRSLPLNLIS